MARVFIKTGRSRFSSLHPAKACKGPRGERPGKRPRPRRGLIPNRRASAVAGAGGKGMIYVVIDTNVLVSALLSKHPRISYRKHKAFP